MFAGRGEGLGYLLGKEMSRRRRRRRGVFGQDVEMVGSWEGWRMEEIVQDVVYCYDACYMYGLGWNLGFLGIDLLAGFCRIYSKSTDLMVFGRCDDHVDFGCDGRGWRDLLRERESH